MKKIGIILMIGLLCGCNHVNEKALQLDESLLVNKTWIFEDYICTQSFTMFDDQSFAFSHACGDPVGDFDLYDQYQFEDNKIIFSGEEVEDITYEILRYDKHHLLLKCDDEIKEFTYELEYPLVSDYSDYFQGYSAYKMFIEESENGFKCAPSFYDGDMKEHRDMAYEELISDDITYYDLAITNIIDENEEINSQYTYQQIDHETFVQMLEGGGFCAFVWYNDQLEIEKIVAYGELTIWQ